MNDSDEIYKNEAELIRLERDSYPVDAKINAPGYKFYEYLSLGFQFAGFLALILSFFTSITLLQATCLFIISHVLTPTDGDRYQSQIKGMAEDLGHIRLNSTVFRKNNQSSKKT